MKNIYLVYNRIGSDIFPAATCSNKADAEELCLAYAQEELYRRWFMDEQFAKPKGLKSLYLTENSLVNMGYNIVEVPHFG